MKTFRLGRGDLGSGGPRNEMNDFVLPANLFYGERLVTVVSGGEQDLLDRLAHLETACAFMLTNTITWHEGLPGEIVRQRGSHLLVSVCPEGGVSQQWMDDGRAARLNFLVA